MTQDNLNMWQKAKERKREEEDEATKGNSAGTNLKGRRRSSSEEEDTAHGANIGHVHAGGVRDSLGISCISLSALPCFFAVLLGGFFWCPVSFSLAALFLEMECWKVASGNLDPERKRCGGLRTKQAGRGSCRGS
ncbi:hypothetical protein MLD38_004106 [Melastoma candidum]|uniref:Uncharacterized protein n=1 Tax=Melastoma candidum TaxID=119954 RepID=A0ACB9S606_9MYRT|nr:hypothetical protein MLD38_004106 [Melastoma candidum]